MNFRIFKKISKRIIFFNNDIRNYANYVQGQSPETKIREYFYFIDHNGQLFLDDSRMKNFTSCFKDKEFLVFFYSRLRKNETNRYVDEFPYVSLCGRERNFVRCDDTPTVYTEIVKKTKKADDGAYERLAYGNAGDRLTVVFDPQKICMDPFDGPFKGRVYYPADERLNGLGLVKSSIADELKEFFVFDDGESSPPTKLKWKNVEHKLTNELVNILKKRSEIKKI